MAETEQIIFVNEDGTPTGQVGPKLASHNATTKRHLAFSCYIFRCSDGKLLVTKRASTKKVWPNVWTNSVCGHPGPNETIEDAIRRRAKFEVGIDNLENIVCVLPKYLYTTPPYAGIVENEFCPVFVAYTDDKIHPNPNEVGTYKFMTWNEYGRMLKTNKEQISYWAEDQYSKLENTKRFTSLNHGSRPKTV